MSVIASKRNTARIEFIRILRDTEIFCLKLIRDKPKKRRYFYQELTKMAMRIYNESVLANSIYAKTEEDFEERKRHFLKAIGEINALGSQFEILRFVFKTDSVSYKELEQIAREFATAQKLIKGVIASDHKLKNQLSQ